MYVIRLPDGRLRVPQSMLSEDGRVTGHGYLEIEPDDPDYQRLLPGAITEEEFADKRRRWRADDEALRLQFEEFKSGQSED